MFSSAVFTEELMESAETDPKNGMRALLPRGATCDYSHVISALRSGLNILACRPYSEVSHLGLGGGLITVHTVGLAVAKQLSTDRKVHFHVSNTMASALNEEHGSSTLRFFDLPDCTADASKPGLDVIAAALGSASFAEPPDYLFISDLQTMAPRSSSGDIIRLARATDLMNCIEELQKVARDIDRPLILLSLLEYMTSTQRPYIWSLRNVGRDFAERIRQSDVNCLFVYNQRALAIGDLD